ncbi:MAG: hypothetical protein ACOY3Y_19975 [Acidobacteriota bacterium]
MSTSGSCRARRSASSWISSWSAGRRSTLSFADGQVAAVAHANELVLVTRNLRHFSPLAGIEVVSWHAA